MRKFPQALVAVLGKYNAELVIACEPLAVEGEIMVGGPLQIFGGARGANCAVDAARAGAEVSFIGAHGHDAFGVMAQDPLTKEGIEISNFRELRCVSTGASLGMLEAATGRNFLLCAESANNHLTPEMVRASRNILHSADLVISELEIPPETAWEAMRICEERDIPFLLDMSPINRIKQVPKNKVLAIVTESVEEAMVITGTFRVPDAVAALHRTGARNVVLVERSREITYSDGQTVRTLKVPGRPQSDRSSATERPQTSLAPPR